MGVLRGINKRFVPQNIRTKRIVIDQDADTTPAYEPFYVFPSSAPSVTGVKGSMYVNSTSGGPLWHNGTAWDNASFPWFWSNGFNPVATTTGTDTTPVNGTVFYGAIYIPQSVVLTGLGYLIGSVGGTDKAIVALYDSTGAVVANSALAGTTVGTTATIQKLDFTATYNASRGLYYVSVSMNGTTARLRTQPIGIGGASSATGTFGTLAAITPPTTFTADKAPICAAY